MHLSFCLNYNQIRGYLDNFFNSILPLMAANYACISYITSGIGTRSAAVLCSIAEREGFEMNKKFGP